MKLSKVNTNHKVAPGSSYIVYVTDNEQVYADIYAMCMTMREMHENDKDWYFTVSGSSDCDCRAPEFFKGKGYKMVAVEHNNGDWNKPTRYDLYIAEK